MFLNCSRELVTKASNFDRQIDNNPSLDNDFHKSMIQRQKDKMDRIIKSSFNQKPIFIFDLEEVPIGYNSPFPPVAPRWYFKLNSALTFEELMNFQDRLIKNDFNYKIEPNGLDFRAWKGKGKNFRLALTVSQNLSRYPWLKG